MRLRLGNIRRLNHRGDTIVEVLISIAVISLILGGAFVTTNRSLQSTRDAQERGDALKLVESQIEQLKGGDRAAIFATSLSSYCIFEGAPVESANDKCLVSADGTPTTAEPAYRLAITRAGSTFTVKSTWTSVRGDVQNNVDMKYRAYE